MGDTGSANGLHLARRESTIQIGLFVLKTALLINGGAAVALLTFIGHLATQSGPSRVSLLAGSLVAFVVGVLVAATASGMAYLSERSRLSNEASLKKGSTAFNLLAIALVVVAYMFFGWGTYMAYGVFAAFPSAPC